MKSPTLVVAVLMVLVGLTAAVNADETLAATASDVQGGLARSVPVTHNRYAYVDGVKIFYREAGPADGPTVFLPHGFRLRRTCSVISYRRSPIVITLSRPTTRGLV